MLLLRAYQQQEFQYIFWKKCTNKTSKGHTCCTVCRLQQCWSYWGVWNQSRIALPSLLHVLRQALTCKEWYWWFATDFSFFFYLRIFCQFLKISLRSQFQGSHHMDPSHHSRTSENTVYSLAACRGFMLACAASLLLESCLSISYVKASSVFWLCVSGLSVKTRQNICEKITEGRPAWKKKAKKCFTQNRSERC